MDCEEPRRSTRSPTTVLRRPTTVLRSRRGSSWSSVAPRSPPWLLEELLGIPRELQQVLHPTPWLLTFLEVFVTRTNFRATRLLLLEVFVTRSQF